MSNYSTNDSIVGWSEEERKKLQKMMEIEAERKSQRVSLEAQVKRRLEEELAVLQSRLSNHNQLPDIYMEVNQMKTIIMNDFDGKAQDALMKKMGESLDDIRKTNDQYISFLDSIGFAGFFKRVFHAIYL